MKAGATVAMARVQFMGEARWGEEPLGSRVTYPSLISSLRAKRMGSSVKPSSSRKPSTS